MNETNTNTLLVNGREVEIAGERNLLELIRKTGIEIPTFCYHSELSIYGACRLCLVDVEGRGIMASCSTPPEPGMVVLTDTREIRESRKINVELLLANHKRECPTCARSSSCALQALARRLGIEEVRYKQRKEFRPVDKSSPSLERDPDKCVLCGDCVRVCKEIQGIGAIDFAMRGAGACVAPAFNQNLGDVECVGCGQCAAVCPTGALIPRQDREKVWDAIHDKDKIVVAQIAPAVRVAMGEYFGLPPGENTAGKIVNAMRLIGFDQVYDTSFTADMTILEEGNELVGRIKKGGPLPMFTSCCPAWVKYAEIYYPELIPNISTCRSPQQMFGSAAKEILPKVLGAPKENLVVVSVMPCTAKKFEAALPKFEKDGLRDVDHVITTLELGRMMSSMGIQFDELEPQSFDMPFGFATGAGVIFGATGGVMEAALRYAHEKISGEKLKNVEFKAVRGMDGLREATVKIGDTEIKAAVVHGLANAGKVAKMVAKGEADFHFIEVMACPGGCISGAGQPIPTNNAVRKLRAQGLYKTDRSMQFQKSQDNHILTKCYEEHFDGAPGSKTAHRLLHTRHVNRSQIFDAKLPVLRGKNKRRLPITVTICANIPDCPGKRLLATIVRHVKENKLTDKVDVDAAFSSRQKRDGTISVTVGDEIIDSCKYLNAMNTEEEIQNCRAFDKIRRAIEERLADKK